MFSEAGAVLTDFGLAAPLFPDQRSSDLKLAFSATELTISQLLASPLSQTSEVFLPRGQTPGSDRSPDGTFDPPKPQRFLSFSKRGIRLQVRRAPFILFGVATRSAEPFMLPAALPAPRRSGLESGQRLGEAVIGGGIKRCVSRRSRH